MNQKTGLILTGGSIDSQLVLDIYNKYLDTLVVVVDKGLETADQLGIKFDYLVGDFDTVSDDILEKYKKMNQLTNQFCMKEFNPEKDNTDTDIAISLLLECNVEEIIILGGTGTRIDHVLGNIHLLFKALNSNVKACLIDRHNKIYLKKNGFSINKKECYGKYVSLIPFTDKVTGVTLKGMKYPLCNACLNSGESLGISNEIIEAQGMIEFQQGILIIIESRD